MSVLFLGLTMAFLFLAGVGLAISAGMRMRRLPRIVLGVALGLVFAILAHQSGGGTDAGGSLGGLMLQIVLYAGFFVFLLARFGRRPPNDIGQSPSPENLELFDEGGDCASLLAQARGTWSERTALPDSARPRRELDRPPKAK